MLPLIICKNYFGIVCGIDGHLQTVLLWLTKISRFMILLVIFACLLLNDYVSVGVV